MHRRSELDIQHPRKAHHHDEGVDRNDLPGSIGETPTINPVSLSLFAGWRLEAHGQLLQAHSGPSVCRYVPAKVDARLRPVMVSEIRT